MTDLERRALLGDRQAQEECTKRGIVLSCPHCNGNGKVSFKDYRFVGQNFYGDKKLVYRIQVICNKCRSRGKPIFTKPLINPNPYLTKWGNCYSSCSDVSREETKKFLPYVVAAISEWNTRFSPPIGRCRECKKSPDISTRTKGMRWCRRFSKEVKADGYCDGFKPKGGEKNEL